MSDPIKRPAPRPCGTCPYRCDVPSGVWAEEEYEKLPDYDNEIHAQPPSVFMCHQQDGRLCAGWAAVHDMGHNLGLRLAVAMGMLDEDEADATIVYTTDVELWPDGQTARDFGVQEIIEPSMAAMKAVAKLERKRGAP